MKKFLIYFPKSISGLFLSILGYLNFILTTIFLLVAHYEIAVIILGKSYTQPECWPNISFINQGLLVGLTIYLMEFIFFLFIYIKEFKTLNPDSSQNKISLIRKLFVLLGGILFIFYFIFAIIIQLCYFIRGIT